MFLGKNKKGKEEIQSHSQDRVKDLPVVEIWTIQISVGKETEEGTDDAAGSGNVLVATSYCRGRGSW